MNTSSRQPTVKRYRGSKFIIAFLVGMALFGAIGFGVTYLAAQWMTPALRKRAQEYREKEAKERELARHKEQASQTR